MSRIASRRLLASTSLFGARASAPAPVSIAIRGFSNTIVPRADETSSIIPPSAQTPASSLASTIGSISAAQPSRSFAPRSSRPAGLGLPSFGTKDERHEEPHHFHVYSHKHNCHITLTNPNRDPIISLSCGNLGFRKSHRKSYDAAFQLASYVLSRMKEQGINGQIKKMEVSLRGFGQGREAVTKALLGVEGAAIRNKIVKVSDATRLKFGGTRSQKPRRLG